MSTLKEYAAGDEAFFTWLREVNTNLNEKVGLGVLDLSDQTYHDWFSDEMSPAEAAELVLAEEGYYDE